MSDFTQQSKNNDELNSLRTITTSDGVEFSLPIKHLKLSNLLNSMMYDEGTLISEPDDILPLPNVDSETFVKVKDFLEHYFEDPYPEIEKPIRSSKLSEIIQPWFAEFIDLKEEELFKLIMAANFMHIQPLLDLGCAQVASTIKGKTPEEIRTIFGIPDNNNETQQSESSS